MRIYIYTYGPKSLLKKCNKLKSTFLFRKIKINKFNFCQSSNNFLFTNYKNEKKNKENHRKSLSEILAAAASDQNDQGYSAICIYKYILPKCIGKIWHKR